MNDKVENANKYLSRAVVEAAIAASSADVTKKIDSPYPSDNELASLADGNLSGKRLLQIQEWLKFDDGCMERFSELMIALDRLDLLQTAQKTESPQASFGSFLQKLADKFSAAHIVGGSLSACAIAFAAIIIVPAALNPDNPSRQLAGGNTIDVVLVKYLQAANFNFLSGGSTRGGPDESASSVKQMNAVKYGIRVALVGSEIGSDILYDTLPVDLPDEVVGDKGSASTEKNPAASWYAQFGSWAVVTEALCQASDAPKALLEKQREILGELQQNKPEVDLGLLQGADQGLCSYLVPVWTKILAN